MRQQSSSAGTKSGEEFTLNLAQVKELLQAEVLSGEEKLATTHALSVCGADLMSDVLAFTKEKTLLLTGLTNP